MQQYKHLRSAFAILILAAATLLPSACKTDAYESGDGRLSYVRADFVEANTDAEKKVFSAQTDDGLKLWLSPTLTAKWISTADSTYRALLYYNTADSIKTEGTVKPVAISQVLAPQVSKPKVVGQVYPTDPLTFESSWKSRNGRYYNLGLSVKTGTSDGETSAQTIGILYRGSTVCSSGQHVHRLQLVHDQNKVPEYYTTRVYVSVPLYGLPFTTSVGDSIEISMNTYDGTLTRSFVVE